MRSKTKIVVLHMKEVIYTGIFIVLGIIFIALLLILFLPGKDKETPVKPEQTEEQPEADNAAVSGNEGASVSYIPGVYHTSLTLGEHSVDMEVIVSETEICSVSLINLEEAVSAMYPLIAPSMDSLTEQIYETQSLDNIHYADDSKYTTLVLLDAIRNALAKATR